MRFKMKNIARLIQSQLNKCDVHEALQANFNALSDHEYTIIRKKVKMVDQIYKFLP